MQARRRALGNIQFIGNLYQNRMLTEKIMHGCITELLTEVGFICRLCAHPCLACGFNMYALGIARPLLPEAECVVTDNISPNALAIISLLSQTNSHMQ